MSAYGQDNAMFLEEGYEEKPTCPFIVSSTLSMIFFFFNYADSSQIMGALYSQSSKKENQNGITKEISI